MRVLFLFHHPFATLGGGVAEYLYHLPKALKQLGIESIIYTGEKTEKKLSGPEQLPNGILGYSGPSITPGFFKSKKKLRILLDLCQQEKIDLIHAQSTYRNGYTALQVKKQLNIPYVITSHIDILGANTRRINRKKVQQRCQTILQQAAAVTHVAPLMAETSHQLYDTREKSTIIANGIDLPTWQGYQKMPEQDYFIAISRLVRQKGFDVLINAYAELRQRGIDTSFVIAGGGPDETLFQNQVKQLGLTLITDYNPSMPLPKASVIFTGTVQGDTKKKLIAQSQLALFAPQPKLSDEAFGIVQLEAMAAAKPLIASDIIATRYLQSLGTQSILVTADDPEAWANEILRLLKNADLRKQMGELNLKNAARFDWLTIAEEYKKVYLDSTSPAK